MAGVVASKVRRQRSKNSSIPAVRDHWEEMEKRRKQILREEILERKNRAARKSRHTKQGIDRKIDGLQRKINDNLDEGGGGNVVLYIGLGFGATGLIIMVVGGGDRGFRTAEFQIIGPVLIVTGFLLVCLQILICFIFPTKGPTRQDNEITRRDINETSANLAKAKIQHENITLKCLCEEDS